MLFEFANNRWFALVDFFIVVTGGAIWMLWPDSGVWPILIALFPWGLRLISRKHLFQPTSFDWLIGMFLVTAWVGYWAAYNKTVAWNKAWLIVLAILLFYALSSQPEENLEWVCVFLFYIGVGVAIYFFLTQDFVTLPRKVELVNRIGRWIMSVIPRPKWIPIHPNYVAGIVAITTPFIFYPARKIIKGTSFFSVFISGFLVISLFIALIAILMATSRGVVMAIASAFGLWIMWRIVDLNGSRLGFHRETVFPTLVVLYLGAVIFFLYIGPAKSGSAFSGDYYYGTGSRSELVARSLYLLLAFPFTGGGLGAFPGLYSYYMLGIPNFNVLNSHNLFLDVAIEQGLLGGLSLLGIFVMSIWYMAKVIVESKLSQTRVFGWLTFFAIVIAFVHGMVDDYLYNGKGTLLLFALVGLSVAIQPKMASKKIHLTNQHYLGPVILILFGFFVMNLNRVRSAWYANLGAVQMAKVELIDFPTNQWTDPSILPKLKQADATLHSALHTDPTNWTANYRLGLIALLRNDFNSAAAYLEIAHQETSNHRGIIKALGYCYVWLGNLEKAELLLSDIPEAKSELDVYTWWWGMQGRADLSKKASLMISQLESSQLY